jgi:hypothetical protein
MAEASRIAERRVAQSTVSLRRRLRLHAAGIATGERPHVTPDRVAFVSRLAAPAAVAFVVFGATGDRTVSVNDQGTGTGCHGAGR